MGEILWEIEVGEGAVEGVEEGVRGGDPGFSVQTGERPGLPKYRGMFGITAND